MPSMRYVSPAYEKQLSDLAEHLVKPERYGDVALQDTVEFNPVFPHHLELCEPVEHGWRHRSAEIPDQAA